jgi:hypothetical protein
MLDAEGLAEGEELETNLLQASQRIPASSGVLDEVFGTHRPLKRHGKRRIDPYGVATYSRMRFSVHTTALFVSDRII